MYKIYEYTIKDNFIINEALNRIPLDNQITFLTYPSEELLYGGMAGGGKTDALLLSALQYVDDKFIPDGENSLDYNALIIRRTLEDLDMPNAIMDRAKQWLLPLEETGVLVWKDQKKRFIFSNGATLTFRYLSHDKHLNSYQGAELQFVGFDELTQFPQHQYEYLHSRLRKLDNSMIPIRMRGASNPGGIGHEWVKSKFVTGGLPFVPASYLENIHLDRDNYGKQLDKLDELTKQQLKYGNWDIILKTGLLMSIEQFKKALIPSSSFADWNPVYSAIGIDPASTGTDKFSMACLVYFDNGKLVLVDLYSTPSSSPEQDLRDFIIKNKQYKPRVINFEREQGSSPHYALQYWENDILLDLSSELGFYVKDTPAVSTGSKYNRAYPHAYHIRNGNMFINRDIAEYYLDNQIYSPVDKLGQQYVYLHPDKKMMEDYPSPDECDSVSYAFGEVADVIGGLGVSV